MKDFLLFNAGECDDAMRDRYFYLVRNVENADAARVKLQQYFDKEEYTDDAEYYEAMIEGNNLKDSLAGKENYSYRMQEVD